MSKSDWDESGTGRRHERRSEETVRVTGDSFSWVPGASFGATPAVTFTVEVPDVAVAPVDEHSVTVCAFGWHVTLVPTFDEPIDEFGTQALLALLAQVIRSEGFSGGA